MLKDGRATGAVAARLQEFWARSTPWQRRLWGVGTVAALKEVLEASRAASESVLSDQSLKRLQSEAKKLAGPDPGVGDKDIKRTLQVILDGDVTADRAGWHGLRGIIPVIERGYLQRWAAFAECLEQKNQERAARYIGSHLLEAGFAPTYLYRWLDYRVSHSPVELTLSEILEEADADLGQRALQQFEVVIPCTSVPRITVDTPPAAWRSAIEMSSLLSHLAGDAAGIRQNGGFSVEVTARDPYAAVERAQELFARWAARVELATSGRLTPTGHAWVQGVNEGIPFGPERRQVGVAALDREARLYTPLDDNEIANRLDDAFQLAQPLANGPRAAAIGGGWASLESLLTGRQERRGGAARLLAAVVTCSLPRAELTTLSYQHQKYASDDLSLRLSEETENLRRARLVADAILEERPILGRGPRDEAAYYRMSQVLAKPRATLARVHGYLENALDRLYRQRNLILHGGQVSGEGRTVALRTSPPIVGAGLDRLAHAWFVEGTRPIELAARAELNLKLVGARGTATVVELLEQPPA